MANFTSESHEIIGLGGATPRNCLILLVYHPDKTAVGVPYPGQTLPLNSTLPTSIILARPARPTGYPAIGGQIVFSAVARGIDGPISGTFTGMTATRGDEDPSGIRIKIDNGSFDCR